MKTFSHKNIAISVFLLSAITGLAWAATKVKITRLITDPRSPSPTETAPDWHTFTNSTFGYTLSYPTNLKPIEEYTDLENSDQISFAYKPGTPDYEVRFGIKAVYPGYLDSLPAVRESLANANLEQFSTYLWDSNKNDINPETNGRSVSDLKQGQVNDRPAYAFTVTDRLTIGKGEAKAQDGSINYPLNTWQDFKREHQITVFEHNSRFFIIFYPTAYMEGRDILQSIKFD